VVLHRRRPDPIPLRAPDPWLSLVAPTPDARAAVPAPTPETATRTAALDAVVWAAAQLRDVRGRAARAVALRSAPDGGVDVVLSRPVAAAPDGWRALGADRLHVPAGTPAPAAAGAAWTAGDTPLLVAFEAVDGARVCLDLGAARLLCVPDEAQLGLVAAALLRTPLALGLDVVLCGLHPGNLGEPPGDGAPGRLHVAADAGEMRSLVALLDASDEPVVVVHHGGADALVDLPVAAVTTSPDPARWRMQPGSARSTLAPVGWPVGHPRPA